MAAVPSLSEAFAAGQRFRATDVNTTNAAANFANNCYVCRVYNDAAQSIPDTTLTALTMPKEWDDAYSWHSTSVNPSYITPTYAGWYLVSGNMRWAASATGTRRFDLVVNGVAFVTVEHPASSTVNIGQSASAVVYANGTTDVFQLFAYQSSGGAVDTSVGASNTYFTVALLGA